MRINKQHLQHPQGGALPLQLKRDAFSWSTRAEV